MKTAWVYLLHGTTGRKYLGSTDDLERRLHQHNAGWVHSTKRLGIPLSVVATRAFPTLREARKAEKMLKAWKNPNRVLDYLQKLDPS